VCGDVRSLAGAGKPCPRCHGVLVIWPNAEVEQNRTVCRVRRANTIPLVAGEHTAQITTEARLELEESFKADPQHSPVNVLACSPTLELGIDVGGLDAIILRNVPPRPDNGMATLWAGGHLPTAGHCGLVLMKKYVGSMRVSPQVLRIIELVYHCFIGTQKDFCYVHPVDAHSIHPPLCRISVEGVAM
jgi:hypothetical protein